MPCSSQADSNNHSRLKKSTTTTKYQQMCLIKLCLTKLCLIQLCLIQQCLIQLCLIQLRMNHLFWDIAYQLNVSSATVKRYFHGTLDVMYVKLSFVIRWPEHTELRKSMPMCFRAAYHNKVVVIIDCFELFTEKPRGALNQVQAYTNYKHHRQVKYFLSTRNGYVKFQQLVWRHIW